MTTIVPLTVANPVYFGDFTHEVNSLDRAVQGYAAMNVDGKWIQGGVVGCNGCTVCPYNIFISGEQPYVLDGWQYSTNIKSFKPHRF